MTKEEKIQYIWSENYRPKRVEDILLPEEIKIKLKALIKDGAIPHLLFSGGPGIGKTTIARALCNDIGLEYIFVNASLESSIDLLRDKISQFARTVSFDGEKKKAIILDEVDGVTSQAFFPSLRPFMETFSQNCTFIMTCNYIEKIPLPIRSRLQTFHFELKKEDIQKHATELLKRSEWILQDQKVEYDRAIVAKIVRKYFPDFRQVLNSLQQHRDFLKDSNLEYRLDGLDVSKLYVAMKEGDFQKIREIIQTEFVITDSIYTQIYRSLKQYVDDKKIPTAIMVLSDFNRDHVHAIDKEIHLVSFLLTFIKECGPFK